MFKGLFGKANKPAAETATTATSPFSDIYALLFCDDLSAFEPKSDAEVADWQSVLFGPEQDAQRVVALSEDDAAESRTRALAFSWLRRHGRETPKGLVFGVVVEVALESGLDVLAAYADGSVRYINHAGKLVVVEPTTLRDVNSGATKLVELAGPLVGKIGPWNKPRLPPPINPNVRISFVVSDGLYFGEGPFEVMARDALAGPLILQATGLLQLVVRSVPN